MNKIAKDFLIWFLPAILVLISQIPMPIFPYFPLVLEIVVTITAAIIIFYLSQMKTKYYILWIIAFVLIILVLNPFIRLSFIGDTIFLAIFVAAVYIANWFFVFRSRP